jgi:hypothetical protein
MANTTAKDPGQYVVSNRMKTVAAALSFVGLIGFIFALKSNTERAWHAYLIALFYFMSLSLGGLFFSALQHVVKAGWSVNVRRFCESFTAFLPAGAALTLLYTFGAPKMYEWLDHSKVAADSLLQHKSSYLNGTFFLIRLALFFVLWLWFAKKIVGLSLKQDETGDVNITHRLLKFGIACILVFGLSYSLFSVDLLMSLEPHFFSTIYGVYCFAGLFQTTMAFMILAIVYMRKKGLLQGFVTEDHLHDLGKFMFAFTVFWAYIAFSQYMLIWYANLPEETIFIIPRTEGAWLPVSLFLLIGKFIVPFIALLPRASKRNPVFLSALAIWILVMQYVDLFWLVYPTYSHEKVIFGLPEITIFAGFLGVFLFLVTRFLSRNSLVPMKDPRRHESMHHHVIY